MPPHNTLCFYSIFLREAQHTLWVLKVNQVGNFSIFGDMRFRVRNPQHVKLAYPFSIFFFTHVDSVSMGIQKVWDFLSLKTSHEAHGMHLWPAGMRTKTMFKSRNKCKHLKNHVFSNLAYHHDNWLLKYNEPCVCVYSYHSNSCKDDN